MPCYLRVRITYADEEFKVKPDILQKALPFFVQEMEAVYGPGIRVSMNADLCTINVRGKTVRVDFKAGTIRYPEDLAGVKNALKRNYSAAVIQHVSQSPRVKQKFSLSQNGQREFTLQRRR